jgi:antitoxin component of MazEF toxin-antitoxin module
MAQGFKDMQKNPAENFTTIEIDQVSGEHYIVIPQWICDENKWYEGTEVNIEVDNNCIIVSSTE